MEKAVDLGFSVEEPLVWARLFRYADDFEFDPGTRTLIKSHLLDCLGLGYDGGLPYPEQEVPSRRQLEVQIRTLVQGNAEWRVLKSLVWDWYEALPDPESAARSIELCFLHGSRADLEEAMQKLKPRGRGFYLLIHPEVREQLVIKLWDNQQPSSILSGILLWEKESPDLTPAERLYCFITMATARDPEGALLYFRKFGGKIINAVEKFGSQIGLSADELFLNVGRHACRLGFDREALATLALVDESSDFYPDALELIFKVKQRGGDGAGDYERALRVTAAIDQRLGLLRGYLEKESLGGQEAALHRPELNRVVAMVLEFFGEIPEDWSRIGQLLVKYRKIRKTVPGLFTVFRENIGLFHPIELEKALWGAWLDITPDNPEERFFLGVAQLHMYLAMGPSAEEKLWLARKNIYQARDAGYACPFSWGELHKRAKALVESSSYYQKRAKEFMYRQLGVVSDARSLIISDVEEYVRSARSMSAQVLDELIDVAKSRRAEKLEIELLIRRGRVSHLTNRDLDGIWRLSGTRGLNDLAWRVASVLNARQAMCYDLWHAWEISGESPKDESLSVPRRAHFDLVLTGLEANEKKVANLVYFCGAKLNELMAICSRSSKKIKRGSQPSGSVNAEIEKELLKANVFTKMDKVVSYRPDMGARIRIPIFAKILPSNRWTEILSTVNDLSLVHTWGGQLEVLNGFISAHVPLLAGRKFGKRFEAEVERWFESLSQDQRTAMLEAEGLMERLADQEVIDAIAKFTIRYSLVLYPDHAAALKSLQTMRVPVTYIWDLENFILSRDYGLLRESLGRSSRVPVPTRLLRLPSALVPDQGVESRSI